MEGADLVAQDLDDEGAAVVVDGGLAVDGADLDLVDELADAIGGDLEADGGEAAGRGDEGLGGDDLAVAAEDDLGAGAAEAVGLDVGGELDDVLDEGELAGADLGEGEVDEVRGAGGDGGDRDAELAGGEEERIVGAAVGAIEEAVGEDEDAGERAGLDGRVDGGELGECAGEIGVGAAGREREGLGGVAGEGLAGRGGIARARLGDAEAPDLDAEALLAPGGAGGGRAPPEVAQAVDAGDGLLVR
ncbi:MAG TPA: hypothetical protein VIK91_05070 [Nannocystis sp.]